MLLLELLLLWFGPLLLLLPLPFPLLLLPRLAAAASAPRPEGGAAAASRLLSGAFARTRVRLLGGPPSPAAKTAAAAFSKLGPPGGPG